MDKKQAGLLAGGVLGGLLVGANAGKILRGIGFGLIAIVLAFVVIFNSVNGVEENSKSIGALTLQSVGEVGDTRGQVKVFGEISTESPLALELFKCESVFCFDPETIFSEDDMIYYSVELQRFEVTRTIDKSEESASGATETVSYENEWITYFEEEKWADVNLEGIELAPDKARIIADKESEELEGVYIEDLEPLDTYDRTPDQDEPEFGTTRALVTYIPQDDREYIVVGEKRNSGITGGDNHIITDQTDAQLIERLGGEETATRWLLRGLAFLLLTFGFTSMLSPILVFTDWIPVAGQIARGAATTVSAIIAGIIVLSTVFFLNFWWAIALALIAIVVGFGAMSLMSGKTEQSKPTA